MPPTIRRITILLLSSAGVWCWGISTASATASSAQDHIDQGRQAYDAGDYEQARREFEQALGAVGGAPAVDEPHATPLLAVQTIAEPLPPPAPIGSDGTVMPYLLAAGDVLLISVWQVPDLTREATVRPDGKLAYPLVGEVPAEGLTLTELNRLLTERFKLYVRNPQVSVELKSMAQQRVVVLGEVNKQGVYPFPGRAITVPEAIAMGEGFKRIGAKIRDVAVLKGYPRQPCLYHLDAKALLLRGEDPQRLLLAGNDIVFVSRSWVGNAHAFIDAVTPMLNSVFQGISAYSLYENLPRNNTRK